MRKKLKKETFKTIITKNKISIDIANSLNIKQRSVEMLARRESTSLLNVNVIDILRQHGMSEEQIFETDKTS